MSQEGSTQRQMLPWLLLAAAAAWIPYFRADSAFLWQSVGLSAVALMMLIPAFRKPVWSNPLALHHSDRSYGFSNGLLLAGGFCLVAGLIVNETLTTGMGAIFIWMAAIRREAIVDWHARAREAEAAANPIAKEVPR